MTKTAGWYLRYGKSMLTVDHPSTTVHIEGGGRVREGERRDESASRYVSTRQHIIPSPPSPLIWSAPGGLRSRTSDMQATETVQKKGVRGLLPLGGKGGEVARACTDTREQLLLTFPSPGPPQCLPPCPPSPALLPPLHLIDDMHGCLPRLQAAAPPPLSPWPLSPSHPPPPGSWTSTSITLASRDL